MSKSIACFEILKELKENKKLVFALGKNDFKTKYAGQYLGIIWAFVQPVITVFVYWFVFEKALNQGVQSTKAGITAPYVLWLIAGLVPWFYFSELLSQGTSALIDYNYLVKKVVFNISTLPAVKMISSLFVHLFFVAFTVFLYCLYGRFPDLYTLQLIYYSFAMTVFVMGLVYASSAIIVFFRDFGQLVSIGLQVGMWVTPIMWNLDGMIAGGNISTFWGIVLKLNPMYYIVAGYRDSLISKVWFWENPLLTIYFWVITLVMFAVGTSVFKRLKVYFADVL